MRKEGEESDQMFVPTTFAWFGLVIIRSRSEYMGGSSCIDITLSWEGGEEGLTPALGFNQQGSRFIYVAK